MTETRKKTGPTGRRRTRGKGLSAGLVTRVAAGSGRLTVTKKMADTMLSGYLDAVKRAKKTGMTVRLTFVVNPAREEPQIEVRDAAPTQPDALDLALEVAKVRGAERIAEILKGADMMSADEFAEEIGATRETVNRKRKRHEVLGLEGAKRGVRFPRWQLGRNGELIDRLPQLFDVLGDKPWAVYRFLVQHHGELDGSTGLDVMRAGRVEEAIAAAKAAGRGDFS